MREIFLLMVLLGLGLLGGVVWLIVHPQSSPRVSKALSSLGITPPAKHTPVGGPPAKPNPFERKEPIHPVTSRPIVEAPRYVPVTPPASRSPEVQYVFPVAQDIQVGTIRPSIIAYFGPPGATLTGVDHGELMERLIYIDKANKRRTLISLVNGSVTAAQTLPE